MKTYSVAIQNKNGDWITNIGKHFALDEVDWQKVRQFCLQRGHLAYGYYYGNKSNSLTSARCRTVIEVF